MNYGVIIILVLIIIFLWRKLHLSNKYIVFLENEYYNFINLLTVSSPEEIKILLNKSTQTTLYKKIKKSNMTDLDRFRKMY